MIRINDKFSIKRDDNGWTLYEAKPIGTNPKTGEPAKQHYRERYYASLADTVTWMMDIALADAADLEDMGRIISDMRRDIWSQLAPPDMDYKAVGDAVATGAWVESVEGGGE